MIELQCPECYTKFEAIPPSWTGNCPECGNGYEFFDNLNDVAWDIEKEFDPDWGSHPGATIADIMEIHNTTVAELHIKTGIPEKRLRGFVDEDPSYTFTEDDVKGLAKWCVSEYFWRNRNRDYVEWLRKKNETNQGR